MLSNNELRRGQEMNVFSAFSFIWMKPIVKKKKKNPIKKEGFG